MTTRLAIDFAPASIRRAIAQASTYGRVAMLAGIAACATALYQVAALSQQHGALEARLGTKLSELRAAQRAQPAPKKVAMPEAQTKAVNHAIAQLNLPWSELLDSLEQATPASIALLAVEPDARKRLLRGMAESRSSEDMIAYVEGLKRQPFFATVTLTRHEINEQDPNRPLRFQFEALWLEEAR